MFLCIMCNYLWDDSHLNVVDYGIGVCPLCLKLLRKRSWVIKRPIHA